MALIPEADETILMVYRCAACNGTYRLQPGPMQVSCTMAHPPGSCCHYAEPEVTEEQLTALTGVLTSMHAKAQSPR